MSIEITEIWRGLDTPAENAGYPGPTRRGGLDRLFQHPVWTEQGCD
jgi:hypothetical protein